MGLLVVAFVELSLTAPWDSIPAMVVGTVIAAAGAGVLIPIGSVAILNGLPPAQTGSSSGTSMLARFAGASIGIAVLGTVLASAGSDRPHRDPVAFAAAAGWAAAAGALALLSLLVAVAVLLARREVH
ncbi:MAG: hypothetical protein ACKOAW_04725, partial [Actinomycetota bacterium]